MSTDAGVTVVVCTYQRPASTLRMLDSLVTQERPADDVLVIDASVDDQTAEAVKLWQTGGTARPSLRYWHVGQSHRGLTRQRNFALDHVNTDLVAFFDDDVVLAPTCLRELERVHRQDRRVVGVGCFAEPGITAKPRAMWRLRRQLGMISSLDAGKYHRSGMSTPWEFDAGQQALVEGDWLPGWGMMWKTAAAKRARFHEGFGGYSQGEDLDFSLRLRADGKLLMARAAELRHLPDPSGRPNPYRHGYMEIYNRYHIHRRGLPNRRLRDVMLFTYAWAVDTLLLGRHLVRPTRAVAAMQQIAGRLHATQHLLRGR